MSKKKPTYEELESKLRESEALLNSIKKGKVNVLPGEQESLVKQLKSATEEKKRLAAKNKLLLRQWISTLNAINSCVWILDKDQRVVQANNAVIKGIDCNKKNIVGKHCFELVHGITCPIPECPLLHSKQSLKQKSIEIELNGIWVEIMVNPILDEKGQYNGAVHVITEITERKRAEEALACERDLLQSVMNGAGRAHLVYLDRDFNFVRVNETYAATCGYRPGEMVGKNHFVLYPHAENEAIFRRVRDTGQPVEIHDKPFEFPNQPERGTTYWDWTLIPEMDAGGQVTGLIFSLFETTERKLADMCLEEELNLRNTLLDNIPNGIAMILKKETREIVASNKAGHDIGAVPGRTCYQTTALHDDFCPFCRAPEMWKSGQMQQLEIEYRGIWYEGIWAPLSKDLYVHYIFNITERKLAEEALRDLNYAPCCSKFSQKPSYNIWGNLWGVPLFLLF